jgi:hypothetical protein
LIPAGTGFPDLENIRISSSDNSESWFLR